MADQEKVEGRAAGGHARAAKLSPEKRSEIASKAAQKRWASLPEDAEGLPRVLSNYAATLDLDGVELPCAVIETVDGVQRILSEAGITNAILGNRSGFSKRLKASAQEGSLGGAIEGRAAPTPLFLAPERLKPFIPSDLLDGPLKPVKYVHGNRVIRGYDASILPEVCTIWLKAREAKALQGQQLAKAQKAEILLRALAKTGIDALIDEATGYQDVRDRQALQAILNKYLTDEWSKWTKTFPDEFYRELFRLKGLEYPRIGAQKPQYVGYWTNNIVYSRLAPGVRIPTNPTTHSGQSDQ